MAMDEEHWKEILAGITRSCLKPLIRDIAASQAEGNRDGVAPWPSSRGLPVAQTSGPAPPAGSALRVREAIRQAVSQIEGMQYVEAND